MFNNCGKPLARARDAWASSTHQLAACGIQHLIDPTMLRRAAIIARRRLHAPAHALLPRHATARSLYDEMRHLTRAGGDFTIHNYAAVLEDLSEEATKVETELFPLAALDFYTRWNLEENVSDEEIATLKTPERGGAQGDYRRGMRRKIANAVDCLRTHPNSKRASIPIPFTDSGSETIDWRDQGQTKCCRELYLYVEEGKLSCTGVLRVQNASIFPKNIHVFGALLRHCSAELGLPLGVYTHVVASLCHDRTATNC